MKGRNRVKVFPIALIDLDFGFIFNRDYFEGIQFMSDDMRHDPTLFFKLSKLFLNQLNWFVRLSFVKVYPRFLEFSVNMLFDAFLSFFLHKYIFVPNQINALVFCCVLVRPLINLNGHLFLHKVLLTRKYVILVRFMTLQTCFLPLRIIEIVK